MELQQWLLLFILVASFVLMLTEWIRIDVTAVLLIVVLAITRLLTPQEALSGFGSEPAVMTAAIFVLSGAIYYTGLSDKMGAWIGRLAGEGYSRMVTVIMLAVAALSAFTHHLTVTAVMLPVTLKLSREHQISPSRLLMPMSFAASLGTTITILGAPAYLIADRLLRQAGSEGLGIFSIAPIGLTISIVGTLFVLAFGRLLLPERMGEAENKNYFPLDGYYTELVLSAESLYVDKTVAEIETAAESRFQVVGWLRNGRPQIRPFGTQTVMAGDVLLVRTTPDELATIQAQPGIALHPIVKYKENKSSASNNHHSETEQLIQAVVAPGSELVGNTIGKVKFLERYRLLVVGIWRRSAWLRTELSRIRLREGDMLVLSGEPDAFRQLEQDRSFLMLVPFHGEPFMRHKARLAGLIMLASILVATLGLVAVEIALLAGATAVILTRCITTHQAYRAVDARMYVFIAGAIPLGLAMEKTGTADLLAAWLQQLVGGWSPNWILLLLFMSTAVITQLMSDAGTTALFGPVAVALARTLGYPPEPFVVTVATAAVASFLTPIGHHGNLLIYGPGNYQFSDFLKVGTPLTLLVALVTTFVTQWLWPV